MTLAEINAWSGVIGTFVVMGIGFEVASPGSRRRRVIVCYGGAVALGITIAGRLIGLALFSA